MTSGISHRVRFVRGIALLAVATLLLGSLGLPAEAEERHKPKTRKLLPVRKQAFERLNKAHEMLSADNYAGALAEMRALLKVDGLNEHEQALMYQTIGYVYSGMENYPKAAEAFAKTLDTDQLSEAQRLNMRYNLGQLYIVMERFRQGIQTLEPWFQRAENPSPDAYMLMAQAYAQLEDYRNALRWAEQGIAKTSQPKERWLQLVLALYFETKNYRRVADVLEQLVARFPKKDYWIQLSAVYGELKQDAKSLAAYEMAYKQGLLTKSDEFVRLAQLYLYNEVPYKGARVLEKGLESGQIERNRENWELLANSWIQAREYDRAAAPLGRAAALAPDGQLYVRLAQVQIEREKWMEAHDALESALRKGGVDNPGHVHLLLGIAHINTDRYSDARREFNRARGYPKTRRSAQEWLQHIQQLLDRES